MSMVPSVRRRCSAAKPFLLDRQPQPGPAFFQSPHQRGGAVGCEVIEAAQHQLAGNLTVDLREVFQSAHFFENAPCLSDEGPAEWGE
jgi:hypothetical protein